jgi:hypothetical protein
MALKDAFVNIAKNAAASAASGFVSSVAGGLRSGLGGSTASSASSPLQTGFNPEPGILLYPSDVGVNMHQASYILFARHSVSGAKVKSKKKKPTVAKIYDPEDGTFDKKATARSQQESDAQIEVRQGNAGGTGAGKDGSSTSIALKGKNVQRTGTIIGLYMPPAVNVNYSMDYAEGEVGMVTEAVRGLFKSYQAGVSMGDAVEREARNVGTAAAKLAVLRTVSKLPIGGEGAAEVFAMETGAIVTPRTEMFFKGIGRRSFSFTFTFIPKDSTETQIVHKIIKEFKIGMSPTFKNAGSVRDMTIPDVFSIQYMHINSQNQYINKIGKCYLKTMDVSYGGDKFVTYNADKEGAPPQKTTITLSFQELEIMDRANVEDGF